MTAVLDPLANAFERQAGVRVVASYGSTAQLAQQIDNGAPFDVFAAADTEHVDELVNKGRVLADSRAVYARGQLALWIPNGEALGVRDIQDLTRPAIRFIAIAQPSLAPYGQAAVDAITAAGLAEDLRAKLVYANSINTTRQYAATGNAEAAFTAYSLVLKDSGTIVKVDPKLHRPIDQALGVVASTNQPALARRFTAFVLGPEGQAILRENGYLIP
jgi:molybdate transport system substrate-binding protein